MKRRNFIQKSALTGGALSLGGAMSFAQQAKKKSAPHKFNLKYAPHLGMFKELAGEDPIDQINFMADQGFTAFEDNGMMKRDVAMQTKIGETLAKRGMTMGVFVIDKGGNMANTLAAGKKEHVDIFLDGCKRAVEVAKRVNAKWMTVVPGGFERKLPIGVQDGHVIEALKRGAEILEPHGLTMVLEPLSDSPDLYLQTSDQTYMICKGVDSPACKILYDIYHMQKTEGHLIHHMDLTWDEIAYIQIGDNPGRKEPTTGEINYKNVFKWIYEKGFDGVLGMEHGNSKKGKEGEQAVIDAYKQEDAFCRPLDLKSKKQPFIEAAFFMTPVPLIRYFGGIQSGYGCVDLVLAQFVTHDLTLKIIVIGLHIEVTMATEVEQNGFRNPFFLTLFRFGHYGGYTMGGLGCGYNALRFGEQHPGIENFEVIVGHGLDQVVLQELADDNACPVVPQPTGVDGRRDKVVAQGVHGQQGRHSARIAKIVAKDPSGQLRARSRLAGNATDVFALFEVQSQEGEGESRKI